jgi:hypothetical protein
MNPRPEGEISVLVGFIVGTSPCADGAAVGAKFCYQRYTAALSSVRTVGWDSPHGTVPPVFGDVPVSSSRLTAWAMALNATQAPVYRTSEKAPLRAVIGRPATQNTRGQRQPSPNITCQVRFGVITAATMKNAVFWDIKTQFVPDRRHITSRLQSPAS